MKGGPPVLVDRAGAVRWLRLNRPERRNAIDEHLRCALADALAAAVADDATEVVVLAGEGPSFCAGADLAHLLALAAAPAEVFAFLARVSETVSMIERCPKPVVAALHGHAVAGGLEIALACDVVVAARGTLIGDGHVRTRLLPAAGSSVRLPRKVGAGLARRLLLSGELLPAERLVACGWLEDVVAPERLAPAVQAIAARLADAAGIAQRNLKRLLTEIADLPAGAALEAERRAFAANWSEARTPEALAAFFAAR